MFWRVCSYVCGMQLRPPPFIPPPERGILVGGFVIPPPRGIWFAAKKIAARPCSFARAGGVPIKKGTKKCPTACMQANEPNATECFSRSRWVKVGQVSPLLYILLYKRRQDGGPLHSQIFSVQRSLNLLNTGKLALSFVRKRVKRGADSSDGRTSSIVIVARGRQIVCIARVVIVAGAQPAPWNRASALKKLRVGFLLVGLLPNVAKPCRAFLY